MLITYVVKIINVIALTIQKTIVLASVTGELILSSVIWILSTILNFFNSISTFCHIVYEDNALIFTELPDTTKEFSNTILNQILNFENSIARLYFSIYNKVSAVFLSLFDIIGTVVFVISEVLLLLTNTILFMGEATWLIITYIPIHLPQLIKAVSKHIIGALSWYIVEGYMRLLKFTNYLTEVPLESFMGIMSAIIIARLCIHFKETILTNVSNLYWSIIRNVLYLYYALYNYFTNSDVNLFTSISGGDILNLSDNNTLSSEIEDINNAADALCVICQERQKTVLTLPCRHICLCTECCRRLYGYQRTCPICRTFIYHSVTVYW